ncbi:hypothetical protein BC938DRAFT_479405 [Jimgerdemannia flammicorona]|uniref:Rhodanese domain-containing protein n=1 Tax=Jimgerdemannia flammicorona TaxID=994334 RepID=A0A433R0J5_9FUNG|nr:hypothetical protein BC938DRAFT_479405 [Jimgerdemannia flammicorona]
MPKPSARERAAKRQAINTFLEARHQSNDASEAGRWVCCGKVYVTLESVSRHVHSQHQIELDEMREGSSDPVTLTCACDPTFSTVILFYKYVPVSDPLLFAAHHHDLCTRLGLTGKIRIAAEGINATLAGINPSIASYVDWISRHPVLAAGRLSAEDPDTAFTRRRHLFFKPSSGCAHVFPSLSVRVVDEICPLGVPGLRVKEGADGKVSPAEFFGLLKKARENPGEYVCLDTRNYYESRIGRFDGALCPPIRRFGAFPDFVERNRAAWEGKTVLAYCTGGIRCEKATAYLRQSLSHTEGALRTKILMLDGGIHNYLEWVKEQQQLQSDPVSATGSSAIIDSLWRGRNYIFDARQSLGLDEKGKGEWENGDDAGVIISWCQICAVTREDRYTKCAGASCHLLVLCCDECRAGRYADGKVFCCEVCERWEREGEEQGVIRARKEMCRCERERKEEERRGMVRTGVEVEMEALGG